MNKISMLELRQDAENILRRVSHGESLILTYRGKPALRLEPLEHKQSLPGGSDPLFKLQGVVASDAADGLSNEDIDTLVYGH